MPSYDPSNHRLIFGAVIIEPESFGPDEFINIRRESAAWEDEVGVGGHVTRSKIMDDRATAQVTVMMTATVNDRLSAAYNLDRITPGGIGPKPFLLQDLGGATKVFAEKAWIQKAPDHVRGRKIAGHTWEIRLEAIKEFHGGND